MNTREQFGKYLLLKKLTEDPLGETFRAGLLGDQGMERVALLRLFNGQGLDGARLWQAIEGRAGIQQVLKSPNLGDGIELGQLEGIPYVSYDYVSGKNMANLLEQAARKRNFVPAEHALLITERIALGLASAAETRHENQRIMHGFLVPHLVIISNEGETRLLGFETGVGLRSFAQNPVVRQHFGRYLSPEALAGHPPDRVDDIYSLGVILFELLTGRPLPPPAADGFNSVIDQGVVATEGTPIPAELGALLKQSLVAREQRIKDVVTWHKTLNKYMFEGQYNPTTFNLAFFMHNLFRQEIERESQEIEVEKTLPLPVAAVAAAAAEAKQEAAASEAAAAGAAVPVAPAAAAAAPAAVPSADPEGTAADVKTDNFIPEYAKEEKSSKTGLIIGLVAAILLLGGGAAFFLSQQPAEEASAPETAAVDPVPQPVEPAEPEYTGPTEEEIKAQIAELVDQQSSTIKQQYDDQLAALQEQLAKAEQEAEDRRKREAERKAEEAEQAEQERLRLEQEAKEAEEEAARIAQAEADAKAAEEAAKKAEEEAKLAAAQPKPLTPGGVVTPPAAESAAAVDASEPPPPAAPQVRRGDLVEPGPGVSPPKAVRPVAPRYPEMARRFNKKSATVLVRVLIDENGEVLKAELAGKKQKFGFDSEALQAAKRSQWRPAKKGGVPVKIWHTLTIEFRQ
ncbi:MAG: TonB family protein [Acidobacteriota bacterium]